MTEFAIVCISLISILIMIFISTLISENIRGRCYNSGNQHNFQPRYDEDELHSEYDINGKILAKDARSMMIKNIYVKDICIWCGKEIKK